MNGQDKSVANARKISVQMIQTKKAVEIRNQPGGTQRYDRLIESANKHAMDIIPQAQAKQVWCTITVEAGLVMVHFNHKDTSKVYAYLYSYDEFYKWEDEQYHGYSLVTHCLSDYKDEDTFVSSRALLDD